MRLNEKKIREDLKSFSVPVYDQEKLRETVRLAKAAYRQRQAAARIGFWKFLSMQLRFISKWVWLSQAVLLLPVLLAIGGSPLSMNGARSVFLIFSCAAPLLAFLGFPEILKSYSHGMAEIEACTRFSMRRLMGARMLILGLADLCCMTMILAVSAASTGTPVLRMILYLFVPFNVTCCGCLTVLDHVKSRQGGYFCAAVCVFCIAIFTRMSFMKEYYEAAATGAWAVLFFCSLAYFAVELIRAFRSFDHFFCSKRETLSVPW